MVDSSRIFPDNKSILPIWTNVWGILFLISTFFYSTAVFAMSVFSHTSFKLGASTGSSFDLLSFANVTATGACVVLIAIGFWDIILFSSKAAKPMRKAYKSLVVEEKIDELHKTRADVRGIVLVNVLNFVFILVATFIWVCNKWAKEAVLDQIPGLGTLASTHTSLWKWFSMALAAAIAALGVISYWLKNIFINDWEACLTSYPHRNLAIYVGGKPGVSNIWLYSVATWLFLLSSSLVVVLGLAWYKKDILDKAFTWGGKITDWPYQVVIFALFIIIVIIASNQFAYFSKGRRAVNAAMQRSLSDRDTYELGRARKSLTSTSVLQLWLAFLWLVAAFSIACLEESLPVNSINRIKTGFRIAALASTFLISLSIIPLLIIQGEVRKNFDRCNYIDYSKDIYLGARNLDF